MSQKIGYQSGLDGYVAFMRKIPGVKYRQIGNRPASLEEWYWLEKYERMLRILRDDHDAWVAALPLPPPPGPIKPEPPTTFKKVAPKTVNPEGGSDQRFCMNAPGVVKRADGFYTDESGAVYATNGDGLEESSVRNKDVIPGLVGAKSMDGRSACECPTVGDPTKNTGSWKV